MTTSTLPFYRKALNDKLVERIEKNPKYSLRAFAKALGMESGALSKILNGTRFLSEERASALIERLDLTPEEQDQFLTSLAQARVQSGLKRMSPSQKARVAATQNAGQNMTTPQTRELTLDLFRTVADWYHTAILELTRVSGFKSNPKWIAKRLNLAEAEVIAAIDRLKKLELLEETDGKLFNTSFHLHTANREISTAALRRRQKQIIEKSLQSLEQDPIQIRNHSARTVAIDPKKIPEAKKRIEAFMLQLCDDLAAENKEEVYELSVQLFPLTQPDPKGVKS